MTFAPFKCPNPPSIEEQAELEAEGRREAEKPGASFPTIFTDGLGGMGCGSWDDGPAFYRQRGFDAVMRERYPFCDDVIAIAPARCTATSPESGTRCDLPRDHPHDMGHEGRLSPSSLVSWAT